MKKISNMLIATVIAFAFFATNSFAQASNDVNYKILPQSSLSFDGTSTLHNFEVKATALTGTAKVANENTDQSNVEKIDQLKVEVPIKKLDSGKSSMNDNMADALKADDNPNIVYQLKNSDFSKLPEKVGQTVQMNTTGSLSIAGVTKSVDMIVEATKDADGTIHFKGDEKLKMTDFGVDPPTMFFGTIKTGDEVTVHFDLVIASK